MAALAVLATASACHELTVEPEIETPVVEVEYQDVSFTVAAPSGIQTKTSYGETVNFSTELLVAVYIGEGNEYGEAGKWLPDVKKVVNKVSDTHWEVTLSLVKNYYYDIVFWAQREKNAPYVINWEDKTITADYTVAANDVTRDAFYYLCKDYNYMIQGKDGEVCRVELTRPFAQINLGASDYQCIVDLYEFVGKKDSDLQTRISTTATMTLSIPSVLNVLTGEAGTPAPIEFALAATTPSDGSYNLIAPENDIHVNGTDENGAQVTKSYTLVGTNYVFANTYKENNPIANLSLTFAYNGQSFDINVPNVPYARNYQTNILGNYFTSNASFEVVIVPGFKGDEYVEIND